MKLLNRPERVTTTVQISMHGAPMYIPGRGSMSNVKIVCPDKAQNTAEEVWNRLKYGPVPDMTLGTKIDKLVFHEGKEDVILYGVSPIEVQRTQIWEGRVVECHIDHFEIIPQE